MEKFAKTPKGQDEIAHRTQGLGLRARRLLILVDGQRSVEDLRGLTGDPGIAGTLGELADAGFIAPCAPQAGATASAGRDTAPPVTGVVTSSPVAGST